MSVLGLMADEADMFWSGDHVLLKVVKDALRQDG